MKLFYILFNIFQCNASNTAYSTCEIFIDNILRYTNCLENLRSLIRLDCRNTHLGSDLNNTADNCMIIIVYSCIIVLVQHMGIDQLMDCLQCQIWVDCTCAIAQKSSKMMNLSRLAGFQDNSKRSTLFRLYKVLMYCRNSQQRRNRHMVFIHASVGKHQNIGTIPVCFIHFYKQTVNSTLQLCALVIKSGDNSHLEAFVMHFLNFQHICIGKDRIVNL